MNPNWQQYANGGDRYGNHGTWDPNNQQGYYDDQVEEYEEFNSEDYEEVEGEYLTQDDFDNMEELERMMGGESDQNVSSAGRSIPMGAAPSHNGVLSAHAAEFWFPECRNCACCKGFKHGCDCRRNGSTVCTAPNCMEGAAAQPPISNSNPSSQSSTFNPTTVFRANATAPTPIICSFFLQGYCSFGDSCRNIHEGAPATSPKSRICRFYSLGTCNKGDSCTFIHEN
jgi:hypothetical protein